MDQVLDEEHVDPSWGIKTLQDLCFSKFDYEDPFS